MDHLQFVPPAAAIAAITMIVIGSRWLKAYLRSLL